MADYFDLGRYSRDIATASPDAQRWFDRGLNWCYGFNHEEAIACFEQALASDPGCAMAHWGIAYALGPNYNKAWDAFEPDEREPSLARARAATLAARSASGATPAVEKALIGALAHRYPAHGGFDDAPAWNDAYAGAMREVHAAHAHDLDVCALFAEALMNRTPWALWDLARGRAAEGADTLEAMAVLETALHDLEGATAHPGLLHLYLHLMEMSPHPERALRAADALCDLAPHAGHLQHMPTHIYVLCGQYGSVVDWNSKAIAADRRYLEHAGPLNFYTVYRAHNYHFKAYGAMFLGQYRPAMAAAGELIEALPAGLLAGPPAMADWLESFVSVREHVLIRFGKWREIVAQPLPEDPDLYCVTTAMMRYARAVAFAASGDTEAAAAEREAFLAARDRVPDTRMLFNNRCQDILAVAEQMLEGEIEYRRGRVEAAFSHLHRAVALDDALPYDEPWGWMQPTRHALGALLLEQDRCAEAEAVYRADLGLDASLSRACQHPDNVWSLHGLHECLTRRGADAEAAFVGQRLGLARARADVDVEASCYCRLSPGA